MKRFIFAVILVTMLMSVPMIFASADCEYMRGDANGDGVITIADNLLIRQYMAGIKGDDDICYLNAASVDTNHPATVGMCDALFISQYLAGYRDENFELIV